MNEIGAADEGVLRPDGAAWRAARAGCPQPDLLLARHSDVLEPGVREALARHLDVCEACGRLAADLDALHLEEPGDDVAARVRARVLPETSRWAPGWLAVAATLAIAAAGGLWWMRPNTPGEPAVDAPVASSPEPSPIVALWAIDPPPVRLPLTALGPSRSGAPVSGADVALFEALDAYRVGRIADSVAPLEAVARSRPEAFETQFYLGAAYLLTGRAEEAVAPLSSARDRAAADRVPEVEWYLATAEQRTGRVDSARARLRSLCDGASEYSARACAAEALLR